MVSEDPRHGHLNGELDSAAHGELQEEFSEPELGQITALLQGLWVTGQSQEEGKEQQKRLASIRNVCSHWSLIASKEARVKAVINVS